MAAVDGLSLSHGPQSPGGARWAVAGAFALAVHGLAFLYLNRPPAPVGFESQAPVELDLLPPPSGAAQMQDAGADATSEARPEEVQEQPTELEELAEIDPNEAEQPPPDPETVTAEEPEDAPPPPDQEVVAAEEPDVTPPVEQQTATAMEIPPDVTAAPPDIEPAVTLPPPETVVAREERVEPPKPAPPPVARKPEPKREVVRREVPRREPTRREVAEPRREPPKPAERTAPRSSPSSVAQQAGGRGGASANAGAARAAASSYGSRIRSLVAAQKRTGGGLNGRAVLSFTVNRAGRVTGVSASGPGPVAAEAQAMLRRAAGSFPSMPAEMTGGAARYSLPISFSSGG